MPYRTSNIDNLDALKREQFIVRERLKSRQGLIRDKMQQIPGELAAAGANSFIPKIFRGRLSDAALNGGKKLVNWYFSSNDQAAKNMVSGGIKKGGSILSGMKSVFKMLKGK